MTYVPHTTHREREGGREREEWPKLQRDDDEAEEERKTGL